MIAGYRIFLRRPDGRVMNYHGITIGDGITPEKRVDDELSGRKRINERFAAALREHGRYAFDWEITGYFDSVYECILDEADRIKRDDSTHPDRGFNVEKIDKKRLAKAEAEFTPGASTEDLLSAALADFRRHHAEEWRPYDSPENETVIRDIAVRDKRSITSAFYIAREAGLLKEDTCPQ